MVSGLNPKGGFGLILAVIALVALLYYVPVTRVFLPLSFAVGVLMAGGIYLWRRSHPIKHPPNVDPASELRLTDDD